MGHPFSLILGSISDPKTDIKMSCFFSSICVMILMDLGLVLGVKLKDFWFSNGSSQISKNLKKRHTVVKNQGFGHMRLFEKS